MWQRGVKQGVTPALIDTDGCVTQYAWRI